MILDQSRNLSLPRRVPDHLEEELAERIWVGGIETSLGVLRAAVSEHGLCYLAFPRDGVASCQSWARTHVPGARIEESARRLEPVAAQLRAYLAGDLRHFTLALDLRGTPFQRRVWDAVVRIPYGQTRCYGEIARSLGGPTLARAVGTANGANPVPIVVPCHRVIGARGSLTGYGGGIDLKRRLLELEGVLAPHGGAPR